VHTLPRAGRSAITAVVARTAAAFRCDPIDHFVGVHNVARLAVDAVGGIDLQTKWPVSDRSHFVDGSRTKELAGIAVFVNSSTPAIAKSRLSGFRSL
jgi:hypothetical protein